MPCDVRPDANHIIAKPRRDSIKKNKIVGASMKIQQVVEKEVKDVSFSLENPQNISICVTSKSDYDFLDLNLTGEDLELSIQFCEMLKRKLLEKYS
jgi:hypothetical protein